MYVVTGMDTHMQSHKRKRIDYAIVIDTVRSDLQRTNAFTTNLGDFQGARNNKCSVPKAGILN